jgi:peptide-methionine (S)-S-oxide reductase
MGLFSRKPPALVDPAQALPGRDHPIPTAERHLVSGRPLHGDFPAGSRDGVFRARLLLGRRTAVLADPGRVGHRGGQHGRHDAQPHL